MTLYHSYVYLEARNENVLIKPHGTLFIAQLAAKKAARVLGGQARVYIGSKCVAWLDGGKWCYSK